MATAFPLPIDDRLWRMPLDRYHAMIRSGILTADDPIELLEGVLVEKMSKNVAHRIATRRTCDVLRSAIKTGWYVDEQAPITTGDSEPEPDACVVRGRTEQYRDRHPGASDVALVVEVADSSLSRDLGVKKRIYAMAGIPTYWLIDISARTLEVYTAPAGVDYAAKAVLTEGQSVSVELDGSPLTAIAVADLLPPA